MEIRGLQIRRIDKVGLQIPPDKITPDKTITPDRSTYAKKGIYVLRKTFGRLVQKEHTF